MTCVCCRNAEMNFFDMSRRLKITNKDVVSVIWKNIVGNIVFVGCMFACGVHARDVLSLGPVIICIAISTFAFPSILIWLPCKTHVSVSSRFPNRLLAVGHSTNLPCHRTEGAVAVMSAMLQVQLLSPYRTLYFVAHVERSG